MHASALHARRRYPFRMRYVLIMAGGSGKRLWPLSRQDMPKQLLRVVGGKSLLRIAFERLEGVVPPDQVLVCTGADYADVVAAELPEVEPANILGEPEGRDSLNAVAWPAAVLAGRDPDAVVAIVTADHIMHPISAFQGALLEGFDVAESAEHFLVTFGVVPTAPHTGYGYLRRGETIPGHPDVFSVLEFKEKPDRPTAEEYLASGEYWWNSGMFVWRARVLLDQLKLLQPKTHRCGGGAGGCTLSPRGDLSGAAQDQCRLRGDGAGLTRRRECSRRRGAAAHHLARCRRLRSTRRATAARRQGNATHGVAVLVDARDNLVINNAEDGRLVAVVGLTDTVIVQTPQITLVCPISRRNGSRSSSPRSPASSAAATHNPPPRCEAPHMCGVRRR